jgi:hypothetical protein
VMCLLVAEIWSHYALNVWPCFCQPCHLTTDVGTVWLIWGMV